jgi:hypothetical protein
MEKINSAIVIIGVGGVLYFHLRARRMFGLQDAIIQKYKFYKVRDELVCLVASDQIEENDFVFQFFYDATNFVIKHTQILNLSSLMTALEQARAEGIDPSAEDVVRRILTEVPNKGAEARRVINDFYKAVLETLVQNSLAIRLSIKHPWLRTVVSRGRRWLSAIVNLTPATPAFVLYRGYKDVIRRISDSGSFATA